MALTFIVKTMEIASSPPSPPPSLPSSLRCLLLFNVHQFVAIQIVGLNKGLMVGVGCSVLIFVISYASERRSVRAHKNIKQPVGQWPTVFFSGGSFEVENMMATLQNLIFCYFCTAIGYLSPHVRGSKKLMYVCVFFYRNTLERVHKRGRFMRPASQRRILQVHRNKILCVELRGELFFGSSQQVLGQVGVDN